MSSRCEFYGDALVEHAAGLLDAEGAARLEAHLADCPECADTLRVIATLRTAPAPVPGDLEARIRSAVRDVTGTTDTGGEAASRTVTAGAPGARQLASAHRRWARLRPLTLPLAAAAAMAGLWIGVGMPGTGTTDPAGPSLAFLDDYDPYGAWPADGLIVAGDPLWSELSVEELEHLLEEMES